MRLIMHLRASRTLWHVGALSGPQTNAAIAVPPTSGLAPVRQCQTDVDTLGPF